jgi:hypothetical protein
MELDHLVMVHPDGLEPVTIRSIVERHAAELERWELAYRLLFATNEAHIRAIEEMEDDNIVIIFQQKAIARRDKRIAYLEAQLKQTQPDEMDGISDWLDDGFCGLRAALAQTEDK